MPAALILAYLARLLTSNPRPPGCLLVPAAGVRAVELFSWVSEGSPSMGVEVGEAAVAFGLGGGGKEIEWFIGRRETVAGARIWVFRSLTTRAHHTNLLFYTAAAAAASHGRG